MPRRKTYDLAPAARDAATRELMDLADRMFRGGQSIMRKAIRLQDEDPKVQDQVVKDLRIYGNSSMPEAGDMVRIESILRGVPLEECQSEAEKRRQERQKRKREWHQQVIEAQRERAASRGQAGAVGSLWYGCDESAPAPSKPKIEHRADGVIVGPWGEAR